MTSSEENKLRQIEEIEALSAIYEDCVQVDNENSYSVVVTQDGLTVTLGVTLCDSYPSLSPPTYQVSAPVLKGAARQRLSSRLDSVYLENVGECVVFSWVEEILQFITDITAAQEPAPEQTSPDSGCEERPTELTSPLNCDTPDSPTTPEIFTAEAFEDRKSVFQGHAATVHNLTEVKLVLAKLCENKKIANATHNMLAYRIFHNNTWLQDCDDDGESAAGARMLHLLEILDVKDVMVVVSRWFGGIHLGPDRFKHINNATRQVLEQAGYLTSSPEKTAAGKKKKK